MPTLLKIARMQRKFKIMIMLIADLIALPVLFWISVAIREGTLEPTINNYSWLIAFAPLCCIPVFIRVGLYRAVIRYMEHRVLWTIFSGTSISTLLLTAIVAIARVDSLPRSSILIFFALTIFYLATSRLSARAILLSVENAFDQRKRIVIYGAGRAGTQISAALLSSREYVPIAFFDDAKEVVGTQINGLKVYPTSEIPDVIIDEEISEIILAIPSASRTRKKEIYNQLERLNVKIKTIPGVAELVEGSVRIEDIREVQIEDLLGRDQVEPNQILLEKNIKGKVVAVTGAGGSIGSEMCRQILRNYPRKLILIEMNEFALYSIRKELSLLPFVTEIVSYLADVKDEARLHQIFVDQSVQTLYHAAAYKHVPIVEFNPTEGILNNSFGTLATALAAMKSGIENFVLISTDKAVRPTNVMGASKRLAEMILQALSEKTNNKTIFTMVRFGNVLGSSGSVVPLFREQIKNGGPVTVTHPEIIRYFMTIPEAAQLVIQAGAMGKGGEVFVLDMGEPVKIVDLARKMIELSGFRMKDSVNTDGDIEIAYTGLRPGEKLYEELLIGDNVEKTSHPSILKANEDFIQWEDLMQSLNQLRQECDSIHSLKSVLKLKELVKEFNSQNWSAE